MAIKIDRQVREIACECYEEARRIIRENRALVDKLVEALLDEETIDGDEFRQIVARYTELTKKELANVKSQLAVGSWQLAVVISYIMSA